MDEVTLEQAFQQITEAFLKELEPERRAAETLAERLNFLIAMLEHNSMICSNKEQFQADLASCKAAIAEYERIRSSY